jgi:transcriptional regulator with XRE-family HTH domain
MGKVESSIKSEILRLARREVRGVYLPLRREVRAMRLRLSGLSKSFALLDRVAKEKLRQDESKKFQLEASTEEVKISRFTPARIRNLRKKLGLSQRELALLAGVTIGAIGLWEKGKFRPAMNKKAILVGLRKLGKRDVKKLLATKAGEAPKPKAKARRVKAAKPKGRSRKPVMRKARRARRKA